MPEQDRVQFNRPRRMRKLKNENEALMAAGQMMAQRIDDLERRLVDLEDANKKLSAKPKRGRPPTKRDNNGG